LPEQLLLEIRLHCRPLVPGDALDRCIADMPVGHDHVLAQDAIALDAEALNGCTRLVAEVVGSQFHRVAAQHLEGGRPEC
jgi:hypothetical protein